MKTIKKKNRLFQHENSNNMNIVNNNQGNLNNDVNNVSFEIHGSGFTQQSSNLMKNHGNSSNNTNLSSFNANAVNNPSTVVNNSNNANMNGNNSNIGTNIRNGRQYRAMSTLMNESSQNELKSLKNVMNKVTDHSKPRISGHNSNIPSLQAIEEIDSSNKQLTRQNHVNRRQIHPISISSQDDIDCDEVDIEIEEDLQIEQQYTERSQQNNEINQFHPIKHNKSAKGPVLIHPQPISPQNSSYSEKSHHLSVPPQPYPPMKSKAMPISRLHALNQQRHEKNIILSNDNDYESLDDDSSIEEIDENGLSMNRKERHGVNISAVVPMNIPSNNSSNQLINRGKGNKISNNSQNDGLNPVKNEKQAYLSDENDRNTGIYEEDSFEDVGDSSDSLIDLNQPRGGFKSKFINHSSQNNLVSHNNHVASPLNQASSHVSSHQLQQQNSHGNVNNNPSGYLRKQQSLSVDDALNKAYNNNGNNNNNGNVVSNNGNVSNLQPIPRYQRKTAVKYVPSYSH